MTPDEIFAQVVHDLSRYIEEKGLSLENFFRLIRLWEMGTDIRDYLENPNPENKAKLKRHTTVED